MNAAPAESHRQFSRVPFSAAVTLEWSGQTLDVTLLDIALKGAMVQTAQPVRLQLEDPCQLHLPLNHSAEVITMVGRIAHLEGRRIGIRCEQMDLTSLTLLRRLLELNTGDVDLMHRELSQLFASHPKD